MRALLPTVHAARATTLALFSLGVLWSGTVTLLKVAAALPLPACDPSLERRWRRFLANDRVSVAALWTPLLPVLLAGLGPRELVFVFDPTPDRDDATLLVLGVVCRRRVLPVAWRVVPQQTAWEARLRPLLDERLAEAAARAVGWHVVLRLKASAGEAAQVRWPDGREQRLAELPTRPGQRFAAAAAIFKGAGRRDLSVVRLGTTARLAALNQEHPHALPFRQTPTGWVFPWPA